MQYTIKESAPLQKTVTVTVTATEVNIFMDGLEQEHRKKVNAPGFREGHAPLEMVRKQFGEAIQQETKNAIVDRQIPSIIADIKLDPVTRMSFDVTGLPVRDKDFTYAFSFYYLPDIELPAYEGAEISVVKTAVQDMEVESILENLRRSKAVRVPVTTPRMPRNGDVATIDFSILTEGGQVDAALSGKDVPVFVGDGGAIGSLEVALKKIQLGGDHEERIQFPADFQHPRLAGQERIVRIHLKFLEERIPAPLDDAFAKSVSPDFASVDELRQAIRKDLGQRKEARSRGEAVARLLDELIAQMEIPLPQGMVARYAQSVVVDIKEQLARSGKTLAGLSKTEEELAADAQREAESICRRQVFLLRLAKKEGLSVPDRDVSNFIRSEAQQKGVAYPQALAHYTATGQLLTIKERFLANKALEVLYSKASVTMKDTDA